MTKFPDFTDDYRKLNQSIHAPTELQNAVLEAAWETAVPKKKKPGHYSRGFSFLQKAAIAALIALLIPVTAFATVKVSGGVREWVARFGVKDMEAVETLVNTFPTQPEETVAAGQEKLVEFTILDAVCDSQSIFATAEMKPLTDKYLLVPTDLGINETMGCMIMDGYEGDPNMTIQDYAASIGKEILFAGIYLDVENSPVGLGMWSTTKADGTIVRNFDGSNNSGSLTVPVKVTCLYHTLDDSVSERYEYQIELTDNSTKTAVKTFTKFADIPDLDVQMKEMVVEKTELGYVVTSTYASPDGLPYHVRLLEGEENFLPSLPGGTPFPQDNGDGTYTVIDVYSDIPSFEGLYFKLVGGPDITKYGPYQILG